MEQIKKCCDKEIMPQAKERLYRYAKIKKHCEKEIA